MLTYLKAVVIGLIGAAVGFSGLGSLQSRIDEWRLNVPASQEIMYVPNGTYLKPAVLGYDNLGADLLFIRGVNLFGERYKREGFDPIWLDFIYHIVQVASDLDPLDHRIYLYGGLMLRSVPGRQQESTNVFKKGAENTDYFFLPLAVGINLLDFGDNRKEAARYIKMAALRPEAPTYLKRLAASVMSRTDEQAAALVFLQEQLQFHEPGSPDYINVQVKILEVQYNLAKARLEDARQRFASTFGREPEAVEELLGATLRSAKLPYEPYGGNWVIDPETGQIVSDRHEAALAEILEKYNLGKTKERRDQLKKWEEESEVNVTGQQ